MHKNETLNVIRYILSDKFDVDHYDSQTPDQQRLESIRDTVEALDNKIQIIKRGKQNV